MSHDIFGRLDATADEMARELQREKSKMVEWCYLRLVDNNQANGRPVADLVYLLENIPATTNSAVLEEKLGDLYVVLGKPSSAIETYQEALKLKPSPWQRVRIRIELADKLAEAERTARQFVERCRAQ